ncbi:hypothetical protein T4B_9365 [Trichinella pseudospiralis]|uniref:Uncharacterized protein n=1 Tax=Trichinella pseudospiralis TaxID=6337 RepID=A0A0V1EB37_TRIPS|nr:hypothetical protein T4A_13586 [Trichinella pseudospiralis]KRZ01360.1 hypothetical protein T4B_9365 [Trichinella pseudospiralis]KRZ41830.1 hypothetical protein T4C_12237 [Trichinella pseudospiralis]
MDNKKWLLLKTGWLEGVAAPITDIRLSNDTLSGWLKSLLAGILGLNDTCSVWLDMGAGGVLGDGNGQVYGALKFVSLESEIPQNRERAKFSVKRGPCSLKNHYELDDGDR